MTQQSINQSVQTELSVTQAGGSDFGLLGMGTVVKGMGVSVR